MCLQGRAYILDTPLIWLHVPQHLASCHVPPLHAPILARRYHNVSQCNRGAARAAREPPQQRVCGHERRSCAGTGAHGVGKVGDRISMGHHF